MDEKRNLSGRQWQRRNYGQLCTSTACICAWSDKQTWWTRNRYAIAFFHHKAKNQAVILQMKHMNSHQAIKKTSKVLISFIFFSEILFLFQFCESQIKATNNKKSPKQTVGTLTCETVFACLFWRDSHSPALTFIYPPRMYSYTFSSRVPSFLWVFPQLLIQTVRVWNRLCTILKMLFSH